ncbi:MAG: hypothetical protein ACTHKG_09120, partial [Nocardioides sp.]
EGSVVDAAGPDVLAGMATDAAGESHPVLWRQGDVTRLDTGLELATTAGVNRSGLVVGSGYDVRTQTSVAWAWLDGDTHVLPAPAGASASADAVDDSGQIVGAIEIGEDEQAAVWPDFRSAPRLLSPLPGDQGAHAFAIASDGTVGGVSLGGGGRPVVWHGGGAAQSPGSGSAHGSFLGFDSGSRAVGTTYAADGRARAAVWTDASSPVRLPPAGAASSDSLVGGTGTVLIGTTGGPEAGTRPMGTLWRAGEDPGVLVPLAVPGFRGVASAASAVTGPPDAPVIAGYSSDPVGRRIPTVWRCR